MSAITSSPVSVRSAATRPGPLGLVVEGFRETISRRRLISYLIQADLKKKGADTLLGNIWWVVDPLLQMLVYVVVVGVIFQRGGPDYPLFVFSAILPWKWFSSSVGDAISSVTGQERLIKQLQFPKIVLPVASTLAGIVNFAFGMIPLAGLLVLVYPDRLSPYVLLIPLIAIVQLVFSLGVALLVSTANVFARDVANVSRHVLRLWFYLSPGLYSFTLVADSALGKEHPTLVALLRLNPFVILFESYRAVIYGTAKGGPYVPDAGPLVGLLLFSIALLLVATAIFKRVEPTVAKVL
jgi:lipopolysaccharide transport system permease protein